jgi:Kef-type K+ transport system membrane component KefB
VEASQLVAFLGVLALLLPVGRAAGEVARRAGQPEVLGALAAGVLLGPSMLGAVWPSLQQALHTGEQSRTALAGVSNLAAVLLLLIAGLEVDLRVLRRELRPGLWVAAMAIVPSVLAGVLFGPWLGVGDQRAALYLGVVLSVTAVSVVSVLLIEAGKTGAAMRRWSSPAERQQRWRAGYWCPQLPASRALRSCPARAACCWQPQSSLVPTPSAPEWCPR